MLGVSPDLLDKFGAVSPQTAKAMAEGIKKTSGVELGLAETGIAGPILGRSAKPLGTAYIALATPSGNSYHEFHFSGSRQAICEAISQAALDILINYMSRGPKSDTDS